MNEHSYIRAVTKYLPKSTFRWKINDNYAGGVPDMLLEGTDRDLWAEFKYLSPFPKKDNTLIDLTQTKYLSALQQKWLVRRHNIRGDVAVVAGCEHGGAVFYGLEWQQPLTAAQFKARCHKHRELASHLLCTVGTKLPV